MTHDRDVADPLDLYSLRGKVALVSGGSRGLGAEIVRAFARAGADVAIASRRQEACQVLAEQVRAETGRRAVGFGCHVGRWSDIDALVGDVYAEFGRVDVLVNSAGISPLYDDVEHLSEELYDKVFDVNLKGPFRLMARVGAQMARDGGGSIVNISSAGAARPKPHVVPYAAAKAGLNAMTTAFAHAFGPTVRVNAIQAGPFLTDVSEAWDMDKTNRRVATYALQRAGRPAEIVGVALFLASAASSFTTGAVVAADGGLP